MTQNEEKADEKKGMVKPVVLERVINWCQKKKEGEKLKKKKT